MSMKLNSKLMVSNIVRSDSLGQVKENLPSSSWPPTSKISTPPQPLSQQLESGKNKSKTEKQHVLISKSMEKTFHRLRNKRSRAAYVEAELINGISNQIRVLRQQRGWTQSDLAEKLGTSQGVVSRLEDPSYGRYSFKTLLNLGSIFDIALFVRFLPFSQAVPATWDTRREKLEAESFDEEIERVHFYSGSSRRYFARHDVFTETANILASFKEGRLEGYKPIAQIASSKKYAQILQETDQSTKVAMGA